MWLNIVRTWTGKAAPISLLNTQLKNSTRTLLPQLPNINHVVINHESTSLIFFERASYSRRGVHLSHADKVNYSSTGIKVSVYECIT